jgi:hypothetical protein
MKAQKLPEIPGLSGSAQGRLFSRISGSFVL